MTQDEFTTYDQREYKTEIQLQQDIVVHFRNKYPSKAGRLFLIQNETTRNLKGVGHVNGVSDLIYSPKHCMCEIKLIGKYHSRNHIETQFEWGSKMSKDGFDYFVFTSVREFFEYIEKDIEPKYTLHKIQDLLEETKTKQIKF